MIRNPHLRGLWYRDSFFGARAHRQGAWMRLGHFRAAFQPTGEVKAVETKAWADSMGYTHVHVWRFSKRWQFEWDWSKS